MNKMLFISAFLALAVCTGSACAAEGISLDGTRLIFDGSKDASSMTVTNSSTTESWLMRFWVSAYDDALDASGKPRSTPFVVTPPLHRLDPQTAVELRVNKLDTALPEDRESVFYLNNLAIPPKKNEKSYAKAVKNGLQFAVNSRIKLFYRPGPLNDPAAVAAAPSKLTAMRFGKTLRITNPTPYYITLVNVSVNGKAADAEGDTMVSPFGELTFTAAVAHGAVKFSTVNDRGMTTDALTTSF